MQKPESLAFTTFGLNDLTFDRQYRQACEECKGQDVQGGRLYVQKRG